jgi:hypothetical protein
VWLRSTRITPDLPSPESRISPCINMSSLVPFRRLHSFTLILVLEPWLPEGSFCLVADDSSTRSTPYVSTGIVLVRIIEKESENCLAREVLSYEIPIRLSGSTPWKKRFWGSMLFVRWCLLDGKSFRSPFMSSDTIVCQFVSLLVLVLVCTSTGLFLAALISSLAVDG